MNGWAIAAIVIGVTLVDLALVTYLVRHVVGGSWNALAGAFPPRPPADDAVRKRFQSFKLGLLNLGFSVHVAADDSFLHLTPAHLVAAFGARPMSVPWEEITLVRRRAGRWTTVKVRRQQLIGPSWCLDLAAPADLPSR